MQDIADCHLDFEPRGSFLDDPHYCLQLKRNILYIGMTWLFALRNTESGIDRTKVRKSFAWTSSPQITSFLWNLAVTQLHAPLSNPTNPTQDFRP